jgi:uncharacterized protein YhbP (UPF0306 family)
MPDELLLPGQDPALEALVRSYLEAHTVVTLAVGDAEGPWAAAVFYASEGFDLYFVSSTETRHGAALLSDPRCGATIQNHPAAFDEIRGVQLAGLATLVPEQEVDAVFARYAAKFPFVRGLYRPEEQAFVIAGRRVEAPFWRLRPTDVYWIDNRYGFGRRRRIRLAGP